jgi:hypothetical protein
MGPAVEGLSAFMMIWTFALVARETAGMFSTDLMAGG